MRYISIDISSASLRREAATWSYTVGEMMPDEQSKLRHFVQGATDDGHSRLLFRAADDAWSELLQIMSAYTVDGQCGCGCDYKCGCGDGLGLDPSNENADPGYHVTLWFPANTYPKIQRNIHELCFRYLSLKMRAEWERMIRGDFSATESDAERVARRLKVEISTRTTVGKTKGRWYYGG